MRTHAKLDTHSIKCCASARPPRPPPPPPPLSHRLAPSMANPFSLSPLSPDYSHRHRQRPSLLQPGRCYVPLYPSPSAPLHDSLCAGLSSSARLASLPPCRKRERKCQGQGPKQGFFAAPGTRQLLPQHPNTPTPPPWRAFLPSSTMPAFKSCNLKPDPRTADACAHCCFTARFPCNDQPMRCAALLAPLRNTIL